MDIAKQLISQAEWRPHKEFQELMATAAQEIEGLRIQLTAARLSASFYENHARRHAQTVSEWIERFNLVYRQQLELINLLEQAMGQIDNAEILGFLQERGYYASQLGADENATKKLHQQMDEYIDRARLALTVASLKEVRSVA